MIGHLVCLFSSPYLVYQVVVRNYILAKLKTGQSHFMAYGQLASISWCQAPIWDLRQIFPLFVIIFKQLYVS
jgi:hypothetical protein